jgi:hypothetical protein
MKWNGYRANASDVGDDWDGLENCTLFYENECRRRLGFGGRIDLSGAVAVSGAEFGTYALVGTAAGAVLSITQSSGAVTSLATGLSTASVPTWAMLGGRLYYANGTEIRVSDAGTSLRTVGITAPASAATASVTGSGGVVEAGEHLVRYRYYDSSRNRLSNPSDAATVTVAAGDKISVGYAASGDGTVDKVIIEMTPVGGSTYYRAATITNSGSSYTLDISDASLIVQTTAASTGEFRHLPPTAAHVICEHKQRLWLWNTTSGELYWSRAGFPESWDNVNWARKIALETGDTAKALVSYFSDLYCIGSRGMKRLVYDGDPAVAAVHAVPGNLGLFNAQCVAKAEGRVFGWGPGGGWAISAMYPEKITMPVDDVVADLADANTALRFVVYEPMRREVAFFFPESGATSCRLAVVLSLERQEWTLWRFRQGMRAGFLNTAYDSRQRLALFDANGYGWRMGAAANDGGGDGVMTVTSGSTATVINGVNTAVAGQMAYQASTGQERLITVATGSAITVSPGFSTAPTTGSKILIGSIRQRMTSSWWPGGSLAAAKRMTGLHMAIRPEGDMGTVSVAYYPDFSATATPATSFAADTFAEGVSPAGGTLTVDMDAGASDGYVAVPAPADYRRAVQVVITAEQPLDGVRFVDVEPVYHKTAPDKT